MDYTQPHDIRAFQEFSVTLLSSVKTVNPAIPVYLIGSGAVAARCPQTSVVLWPLLRLGDFKDVDLLVHPDYRDVVFGVLKGLGCRPNSSVSEDMALRGRFCMHMIGDEGGSRRIEVFVNPLYFGVRIDLLKCVRAGDADTTSPHLPVSALICSKLLYSTRSTNQLADLVVLLDSFNEVTGDDKDRDQISIALVCWLTRSWGAWRTFIDNLRNLREFVHRAAGISAESKARVLKAVDQLEAVARQSHKSIIWHIQNTLHEWLHWDPRNEVEAWNEGWIQLADRK